ncbi:MAG: BlaI/MecI/CopY family transcriptional regulator [Chloroflexi bacterium]|nr:BlaI/MecI/CopY family transcriptional regulator [Chloroflexota bacterium]
MSQPNRAELPAFKLDQQGLARVFGELEAAVMDAVWSLEAATVAEVCARLGQDANYKTVTTVMNRLVAKGALRRRHTSSRAFVYSASESRAAFETRLSRRVAEGLLRDFGALAVAQFVDAMDAVDPELRARLETMVKSARDSAEPQA